MDLVTLLQVASASMVAIGGPGFVVQAARWAFPNKLERLRTDIERNAQLLQRLPDDCNAYKTVLGRIEADVAQYARDAEHKRRDPLSVYLGIAFILMGLLSGRWATQAEGPWVILAVILAAVLIFFGTVGFAQGVAQTERDEKGNPLKDSKHTQ